MKPGKAVEIIEYEMTYVKHLFLGRQMGKSYKAKFYEACRTLISIAKQQEVKVGNIEEILAENGMIRSEAYEIAKALKDKFIITRRI